MNSFDVQIFPGWIPHHTHVAILFRTEVRLAQVAAVLVFGRGRAQGTP